MTSPIRSSSMTWTLAVSVTLTIVGERISGNYSDFSDRVSDLLARRFGLIDRLNNTNVSMHCAA